MTGSSYLTSRLVIVFFILFSTGCQFLPKYEDSKPAATPEHLEALSQALSNSFQQQLAVLEQRQKANQQQQSKEIKALKKLVESFQQENIHYQRQHTFQIEQLSRLFEPSVTTSHITEIIQNDGKLILGQYEWLLLPSQKLVLPARIDSGANTSSLHALNLQQFERDGKTWVRFETHYQAEENQPPLKAEIEAPLVRKVNVTQANGSETRPVVFLPIQLGALTQNIEFTLTDRSNLTFPILLGRRFFMDIAIIDVSKAYVQGKPEVAEATKDKATKDKTIKDEVTKENQL